MFENNRSRWLLVIFLVAFIFISGMIVLFALLLPAQQENPMLPTLSALLTVNTAIDDVVTQEAGGAIPTEVFATATLQSEEILLTPAPTNDGIVEGDFLRYESIPGDTITAICARFGVNPDAVIVSGRFLETVFLPAGTIIQIPKVEFSHSPDESLIPDSAVVYGLKDVGFDVQSFVEVSGGYLSEYEGDARGGWLSGAAIVDRVSKEHSISAKLLLAVLEYRSGWVYGNTEAMRNDPYPIGFNAADADGLYEELYITARILEYGYYGWRDGSRISLTFADQQTVRMSPMINAGTAAIETLFASLERQSVWEQQLFSENSFSHTYVAMFGDPWIDNDIQILDWLTQPELSLPFQGGDYYHLTSGPHRAWGLGSPWAAVDFAPADNLKGCIVSPFWITASAPGRVVRSGNGVVVIDLDDDGWEQTGWVVYYLHIADEGRIANGSEVTVGTQIGHASCEGGTATGSHVHIARKYNGEWIPAAGAIPMVLSGWTVTSGEREYQGSLIRGNRTIVAYPSANTLSLISLND